MQDNAYFCPECGSPAIERSALVGGAASCKTCSWQGKNEDLHEVPFEHDFPSPEAIAERFAAEFSGLIAKNLAQPIGSMLLKWGFMTMERMPQELGLYMRAIATASAKAVLEVRQGLETGAIKRPEKKPEGLRKGVH
jgi:hypothetical protein